MSRVTYPGVYLEEIAAGAHAIAGVETSTATIVGRSAGGPVNAPVIVRGVSEYRRAFGARRVEGALARQVEQFFAGGGRQAVVVRMSPRDGVRRAIRALGLPARAIRLRRGRRTLVTTDRPAAFNMLCAPETGTMNRRAATRAARLLTAFCEQRGAMYLIDPPAGIVTTAGIRDWAGGLATSPNSALYFPRVRLRVRRGEPEDAVSSGTIAGLFARTDATRGVWTSPAGADSTLTGVVGLSLELSESEIGALNPLGINCLRRLPGAGCVCWGARTTAGGDARGGEYKYVSVRRTALFIERSITEGTTWAVFEPSDEPLWAKIRASVGAFMQALFRAGALVGGTPREAYYVKCDRSTMTQSDIDSGIVNIEIGVAPLKPAEFVIIRIGVWARRP
ncbi:MAG: phage tail sheath family protein [Phycisphaerales bacterium]